MDTSDTSETNLPPKPAKSEPAQSEFSTAYPHLLTKTAALLGAPLDQRLTFIQSDKYVPTTNGTSVLRELLDVYATPRIIRQQGAVVVGDSQTGKSALIREFIRLAREHPCSLGRREPIVELTMPVDCNEPKLNYAIVRGLNVVGISSARNMAMQTNTTYNHLITSDPKCIIIQETNNLAHTSDDRAIEVCDCLKNIMHDRGIMVVLVGSDEFIPILLWKQTEQLANRLLDRRTESLSTVDEVTQFATTLAAYYPFQRPTDFADLKTEKLIADYSGGVIGRIVSLCDSAAKTATFENRQNINFDDFQKASYKKYVGGRAERKKPGRN